LCGKEVLMGEKIVPTKENIKMFDVKYLIVNEDKIDWEKLSTLRTFTIPEIKLFGRKIAWALYLLNHEMSQEEIDVAAKYVSYGTFELFSLNNLSEKFISENQKKLNWLNILKNSNLKENFIFDNISYWEDYSLLEIRNSISSNKYINLERSEYKSLSLYLKLKS
jgi:hypothetical protein